MVAGLGCDRQHWHDTEIEESKEVLLTITKCWQWQKNKQQPKRSLLQVTWVNKA